MKLPPGRQPFWVPNTNVFIAAAGQFIVQVELSSLRSTDVEITVEGHTLRIAGDRHNSTFAAAKTILVHEMQAGPFQSVLEVPPDYDPSQAQANYLNGVLCIIIPRADSARGT